MDISGAQLHSFRPAEDECVTGLCVTIASNARRRPGHHSRGSRGVRGGRFGQLLPDGGKRAWRATLR